MHDAVCDLAATVDNICDLIITVHFIDHIPAIHQILDKDAPVIGCIQGKYLIVARLGYMYPGHKILCRLFQLAIYPHELLDADTAEDFLHRIDDLYGTDIALHIDNSAVNLTCTVDNVAHIIAVIDLIHDVHAILQSIYQQRPVVFTIQCKDLIVPRS